MALHFLLLLRIAIPCSGFNLSPEASILFEDPNLDYPGWRESYFGYAVGLRSRRDYNDTWLLVGAPRGNATSFRAPVGINEPGVIYVCPLGTGGGCEELVVDVDGNTAHNLADGERAYRDLKDGGWLGASIDTQDSGGEASMMCAPLWKNQLYKSTDLINGACYVQDSKLEDGTALKLLPLTQFRLQNYRISNTEFFHYAHGQLGMSIHFPKNLKKVLVGAPGIFNWHGSIVEMEDPESESIGKEKGPLYSFSDSFIPNPHFTSSIIDTDFFGYSISSGKFVDGETHYIAGAPRGSYSIGKVLVFQMGSVEESELDILVERNGQQIGEYFGAAVTAVDFNGDGLDELVVGAPFKSQASVPDHGMVYVYNNLGLGQINVEATRLDGSLQPMARFGSVVMSPGDLDADGYKDLIVGAPHEGPGAVYVYLGSEDGLIQNPSQRISAEGFVGLSGKPLAGFGISISRSVDVDGNHYPDVAVGSYSSGHALVLRTRPVAILRGSTATFPPKLTFTDKFFVLKACVKYSGVKVPNTELVTVHLTLDHQSQQSVPRVSFLNSGGITETYNITLRRRRWKCDEHKVRVEAELINVHCPIGILLQTWLADSSLSDSEKTLSVPGTPTAKLVPVTSPVTRPSQRMGVSNFISITTGCEEDGDDTCRSDLRVQASYPGYGDGNPLIIGKRKRVTLVADVQNFGEPAFLSNITFSVQRPLDILLPTTHSCERLGTSSPSIACRLNNPLILGQEDKIEIEIDVERLTDASPPVAVNVTVGSSDVEVTPADNFCSPSLQVGADIKIQLHGSSTVFFYHSNTNLVNATADDSLFLVHSHTLVKKGPTPAGLIRLTIEIPVRDSENNTLLTVHAPERNFRGQVFPCYLEGAEWESAAAGQSINYTDIPDGPQNLDQTFREETLTISDENQEELLKRPVPHLNCREVLGIQCAFLKCDISSWPHDSSSATIKFRLGLNLTTLANAIPLKNGFVLSTEATAMVSSIGPAVAMDQPRHATGSAHSSLLPGEQSDRSTNWWWWYLLAVGIGLLLLSALIYGLYKMGFFRRKEQEEMQSMTATITQQDEN